VCCGSLAADRWLRIAGCGSLAADRWLRIAGQQIAGQQIAGQQIAGLRIARSMRAATGSRRVEVTPNPDLSTNPYSAGEI